MESILFDAEAQKYFGTALVGFAVSEVKSQVTKLGEKMTRTEAFDKAWRIAFQEKDFSLVDEIYHPDYKAVDVIAGVEVNLDADKEVISTLGDSIIATPPEVLQEDENFLKIKRYNRYIGEDIFNLLITSITYKEGKIITQESVMEELDYDPSEGQDWNWEDYE